MKIKVNLYRSIFCFYHLFVGLKLENVIYISKQDLSCY